MHLETANNVLANWVSSQNHLEAIRRRKSSENASAKGAMSVALGKETDYSVFHLYQNLRVVISIQVDCNSHENHEEYAHSRRYQNETKCEKRHHRNKHQCNTPGWVGRQRGMLSTGGARLVDTESEEVVRIVEEPLFYFRDGSVLMHP
jgi:hypothetical protein